MQKDRQWTEPSPPDILAPASSPHRQPAQPQPPHDWYEAEQKDVMVRTALWFVAFCAGALAIIRLIRLQRGDFSN